MTKVTQEHGEKSFVHKVLIFYNFTLDAHVNRFLSFPLRCCKIPFAMKIYIF